MAILEVLNPVAATRDPNPAKTAPRPATLAGKKVGLVWNGSPGGDVALKRVGELIRDRVPSVSVEFYSGTKPVRKPLLEQALRECDVFVGATAD